MRENKTLSATIYTDGSCNTEFQAGAWVAIVLIEKEVRRLNGLEMNTTHNRMELTAVIKAIEFIRDVYKEIFSITICSDSQYIIGLQARGNKIKTLDFASKKGRALQNADLLKRLLELFSFYKVECVKIKAHQKKSDNNFYNIEADLLSRKIVRAAVKQHFI